jgi:DNA-binding transcriptional ArsR family regulator
MRDGPSIAGIAALIGDHARAEILTTLLSGEALTATELAAAAGVTKQTASTHLTKLLEAQLLTVESQGRHRYFRLADSDVAQLLENLMGVAFRTGAVRVRSSPREPALRKARICYDHLAGEMGVLVFDSLRQHGYLAQNARHDLELSDAGMQFLAEIGIKSQDLTHRRRAVCRACLDWSVRRHHLAGVAGAALLQRFIALGWAQRESGSRVIRFSAQGECLLRECFSLPSI